MNDGRKIIGRTLYGSRDNDSFGKMQAEFDSNFARAKTGFGVAFLFTLFLTIALLGVLGFVAYHFISKVW